MPTPGKGHTALNVATRHRLAGTALSGLVQRELRLHSQWCDPRKALPLAPVVILLSHFEPPQTIPRLLSNLNTNDARVILVYDGAKPHDDLVEIANYFRVWSAHDLRDDIHVLLDQVRNAQAGRASSQDLFARTLSGLFTKNAHQLTPRESEVAHAFCGSDLLSPEQIASQLGLSPNTVRVHLSNVRRKLGDRYTGNRDALRSALIDRGWIN